MPMGRWQAICGGCGMRHHRHRRPKHMKGWFCCRCGRLKGKLTWAVEEAMREARSRLRQSIMEIEANRNGRGNRGRL